MIAYYDIEDGKGKVFGGVINLDNVTLFDVKVKEAKLLLTLDAWYIMGTFEKVETKSVVKLYDRLIQKSFVVRFRFHHRTVEQKRYLQYLQLEELMELILDYVKCPDDKKKKAFEKKIFEKMYV
jgi:hypothetical protein